MSDGFDALEHRLGALLANTDAAGRTRIAHQIGRQLRQSQSRRIRAQANPDGSAYEPRQIRKQVGAIRRSAKKGPMFRKMGRAGAMNWDASPDEVTIGYADNALSRIAQVHQFGLRDTVTRDANGPSAEYPKRELLGLTEDDRRAIMDVVLKAMAG